MPPFIFRKRLRSDSPEKEVAPRKRAPHDEAAVRRPKQSVFQTLDAVPAAKGTLSETEALFEREGDDSDSKSSEDEFEDVEISHGGKAKAHGQGGDGDGEEEEWEDALSPGNGVSLDNEPMPEISGDLELTIPIGGATPAAPAKRKGGQPNKPKKTDIQIRSNIHHMHVQCLMIHNRKRNSWIEDKELQNILVNNITTECSRAMDLYWRDANIEDGPARKVQFNAKGKGKGKAPAAKPKPKPRWWKENPPKPPSWKSAPLKSHRNSRDWGAASTRLEPDMPNLSAGDPILRLLTCLSKYWFSVFTVTDPPLHRRGYLEPAVLETEMKAWVWNPARPEVFGERLETIEHFRDCARELRGSRDVGQQLFTALLRGLGLKARMVVSLQPLGLGFTMIDNGKPWEFDDLTPSTTQVARVSLPKPAYFLARGRRPKPRDGSSDHPIDLTDTRAPGPSRKQPRSQSGSSENPINLTDDGTGGQSSSMSADTEEYRYIRKKPHKKPQPSKYLPFPTYWTEIISDIDNKVLSVSPLPRSVVSTSTMKAGLSEFYPDDTTKGTRWRQVFAYVIAFSSDGTAKEVTTRYLPKHEWPGKTKGLRMPEEDIEAILKPYARADEKRQTWDDIEDKGDLVAVEPEPKDMFEEGGKETVQRYKNSKVYTLERFIKREEVLKPGAEAVRTFTTGTRGKQKTETVFRREDVVICKSPDRWLLEGRQIKEGEQPVKHVPMRAWTTNRKREIEAREREEGERPKQGLYLLAQTELILPDPIKDGTIPKNQYGNIEVYAPNMIPQGAVYLPFKGAGRLCSDLGIDYADACTGFEFPGGGKARHVISGVVVAEEYKELVEEAWEIYQEGLEEEAAREKREFLLGLWMNFCKGLLLSYRLTREHGPVEGKGK